MIPPVQPYTTIPASKIAAKIAEARSEIPSAICNLIGDYAVIDYSEALQPLYNDVDDPKLEQAIMDAFGTPDCDPRIKVEIINLALRNASQAKLHRIVAQMLDSGQDVYLNNTTFYRHGCHLAWLFMRFDLLGRSTVLPHFGKVHFTGADLNFVFLDGAYLPGAIFKGASFGTTGFGGTFLYGADFSDTDVVAANFHVLSRRHPIVSSDNRRLIIREPIPTNLSFATFANSDVTKSDFSGAILHKTNFSGTKNRDKAQFTGADLSTILTVEAPPADTGYSVIDRKWHAVYVAAYKRNPSHTELAEFILKLPGCHPDQLLPHANDIAKLGGKLSDYVKFARQPNGDKWNRNLWLMAQDVQPDELAAYNQFRALGHTPPVAVKLIKENRMGSCN